MDDVRVTIEWLELGLISIDNGALTFPQLPSGGGVYRYRLELGNRSRLYVGETAGFGRRFAGYRNPGPSQSTNLRMRDRLQRLLADEGGRALLEVVEKVTVEVGGVPY